MRLPFRVPTEPLFQAKWEALEREGKNSFLHLSLPEAVLKFKQGFGRLIRTKADKGTVVILDKRICTKNYGRAFLTSIPGGKIIKVQAEQIPKLVKDWLESCEVMSDL
jgi:ATP-dependent DNA helicase DinG